MRLTDDRKYEPYLVVGVLCASYRPIDETHIIPDQITTAEGRTVPIVLIEGRMLYACNGPVTQGCGVSTTTNFDECGSIGGVVISKTTGTKYFVTCEHVLTHLQSSIPAGETTMRLSIPSVQAKKRALFNSLANDNALEFSSPLDCVVYHSESPRLKTQLSEDPILLHTLRTYLFDGHDEFTCEIGSTLKFANLEVSMTPFASHAPVKLTGDIGLIPVPPRMELQLHFPHEAVVTWKGIVNYLVQRQKIQLSLHGAASGFRLFNPNSPNYLINFIHIKQKLIHDTNMKYTSQTLFDRVSVRTVHDYWRSRFWNIRGERRTSFFLSYQTIKGT